MAKVVINGKNYGPHPFFFQVRDWNTHAALPGIELKDIGQKLGYNGMDNGAMYISNVKVGGYTVSIFEISFRSRCT